MTATPLTQMEKATTIPDETLYLVEMGDGSGTKTVTQKTLAEETGKALKVGNLEELQTENKESLVKAINEAAQSGGGGASVDILDSKEEIEANTETGKIAGASAVKELFTELNDNLTSLFAYALLKSSAKTLSANENAAITATISDVPNGYLPLMVAAVSTGNSKVSLGSINIPNNNAVSFYVQNNSASNASVDISGKILCIRSECMP